MSGLYAAALALSFVGMGLVDARWRLALFRDPVRALVAVLAAAAVLLWWDLTALHHGLFLLGSSPALLGVEVAPGLPLEELGFIVFLPYCSLVFLGVFTRLAERRRAGRNGGGAA